MATAPSTLRVFASKPFMRFARSFGIDNEVLLETVNGAYDADLGGGAESSSTGLHGKGKALAEEREH